MINPRSRKNPFKVGYDIDIWSLGISMYLMAWGHFPDKHQGDTKTEIMCFI